MSKGQCHKCRKVFGKIVQKNSEKCFEKLEKILKIPKNTVKNTRKRFGKSAMNGLE